MRAGTLRHKIIIQQKTTGSPAQDASGVPQFTWEEFIECYAAVEPVSGREYWQAQQYNAERNVVFRIHYHEGVIPRMRVSFDARTFDIESVINAHTANRDMLLMTTEIVDAT
jgi:SPP1 family predicted phage head-tail adaptor